MTIRETYNDWIGTLGSFGRGVLGLLRRSRRSFLTDDVRGRNIPYGFLKQMQVSLMRDVPTARTYKNFFRGRHRIWI